MVSVLRGPTARVDLQTALASGGSGPQVSLWRAGMGTAR